MREIRYAEMERLSDNASREDVDRALTDKRNRVVEIHNPGSVVRSNGKRYTVNALGQWVRVGKERR